MVLVGHDPARIVLQVARRVPPIDADVAAAAKGQRVVDHQHLLMVTGAEWHVVVQPELDACAAEPFARPVREELLAGGDGQRRLPDQHADIEVRPRLRQRHQDAAHLVRIGWSIETVWKQPRARIEPPSQQQDRSARLA